MMRFLIVKTSALGDIIHAFPVVHYLRARFPDAQIDWVAEEQGFELIKAHPDVSKAICIKTKKWRKALFKKSTRQEIKEFRKELHATFYDYVIDLQGNVKSGWVTAQAKAAHKVGFGWKSVPEWPNFFCTSLRYNPPKGQNIRDDYLYIVRQIFEDSAHTVVTGVVQLKISADQRAIVESILSQPILQNRKKILVCPGSAWVNKQMSENTLTNLLKRLEKQCPCGFLVIWGNQEELQLAQRLKAELPSIAIVDRLALPTLQQLMCAVDLVISVDSLPLHLAGTTKTATFSVFGPSSSKKYQPQGTQHIGFQGSCPYGRTFEKRCPILRSCSTGACIHQLSDEQLFEKLNKTH